MNKIAQLEKAVDAFDEHRIALTEAGCKLLLHDDDNHLDRLEETSGTLIADVMCCQSMLARMILEVYDPIRPDYDMKESAKVYLSEFYDHITWLMFNYHIVKGCLKVARRLADTSIFQEMSRTEAVFEKDYTRMISIMSELVLEYVNRSCELEFDRTYAYKFERKGTTK